MRVLRFSERSSCTQRRTPRHTESFWDLWGLRHLDSEGRQIRLSATLAGEDRDMAVTAIPRTRMSEVEWRTRVNLAACYRLVDLFGWSDLVNTHITARIPGAPEHFLINRVDLLYDEITASSLVKIDNNGNDVEPTDVIGAKVRAAEVLLSAAVGEAWGNGSGEDRKVGAFHIERFQVLKRHVAARKSRRSVASRAEGAGHPLEGRHHRAAAGDRRSARRDCSAEGAERTTAAQSQQTERHGRGEFVQASPSAPTRAGPPDPSCDRRGDDPCRGAGRFPFQRLPGLCGAGAGDPAAGAPLSPRALVDPRRVHGGGAAAGRHLRTFRPEFATVCAGAMPSGAGDGAASGGTAARLWAGGIQASAGTSADRPAGALSR